MMKRLLLLFVFILFSIISFAQSMYSAAIESMGNGEYEDALVYWKGLNDRKNTYGNQIAICNTCIELQAEAQRFIATKEYVRAIEKYRAILNRNTSDRNARSQIERLEKLQAEKQLRTYDNPAYAYTFKYPEFMSKEITYSNEKTVFWSSNYELRIDIDTKIHKSYLTNAQILEQVAESYQGAEVTLKVLKENWIVISGYQADGKIFYNKSVISTRKSQYNEYVKILVSAVVVSPKNDSRGKTLAECVSKNFLVKPSGPLVKVNETDHERWQRARRVDTKQAYQDYLTGASAFSPYREEAKARKAVFEAREDYDKELYFFAKRNFELGEKYLQNSDKVKYEMCCYRYCIDHCTSIPELKSFIEKYSNSLDKVRVIKGRIVILFCKIGLYDSAKEYVKNNHDIWYNETTPYNKKQWNEYIISSKSAAKKQKSKAKTINHSYTNTSKNKFSGAYNNSSVYVGYTLGLGVNARAVGNDEIEGGFMGVNVVGGIGDNFNRFNLLLYGTFAYSGDLGGRSISTTLAPRWNIIADGFYIFVQPEIGYDFSRSCMMYGASMGFGGAGEVSAGYVYDKALNTGMVQISYVYNWYL